MIVVTEHELNPTVVRIRLIGVPASVSQDITVDPNLNGVLRLAIPDGSNPGRTAFHLVRFANKLVITYSEHGTGLRDTHLTVVVPSSFTGFLENDRRLR